MTRFSCGVCFNVCEMPANVAYSDPLYWALFALKLAYSYCVDIKNDGCVFPRVKLSVNFLTGILTVSTWTF